MKTGIYAGSFDPITLGHLDVIKRAAHIVDRLVIGVLNNTSKTPAFSAEERVELIRRVTKDIPNVVVETFDGLTIDFAKRMDANLLVRGLRAVTDFEYELQIAQVNHKLNPNIDTIFLITSVEYSYLSSSIVKEIAHFGGDISGLVPKEVMKDIVDKLAK
ncbi:MAG: pantetheine-phosphate adenylyltransferase [Lachnospiraceae bacterium]|nr:pantetheine-phosphate adenylyltransferase [Lachnospiraceae bacterium]